MISAETSEQQFEHAPDQRMQDAFYEVGSKRLPDEIIAVRDSDDKQVQEQYRHAAQKVLERQDNTGEDLVREVSIPSSGKGDLSEDFQNRDTIWQLSGAGIAALQEALHARGLVSKVEAKE